MKHLFLLIIIAVLSSCHEPYFENAFTEGVEYKQLPVEIQGKYLVINRFLDGDNNKVIYTIDTAQDSLLVTSRRFGFTGEYSDTTTLAQSYDEDAGTFDSATLMLYKGVYYVSEPVLSSKTGKIYYKIWQFKPTPAGIQFKYISYDYGWLVEKMKTRLEFKEEFFTKDECYSGCTVGVFRHNHADLHEFFEKEIPDSLATLLVRVQ